MQRSEARHLAELQKNRYDLTIYRQQRANMELQKLCTTHSGQH